MKKTAKIDMKEIVENEKLSITSTMNRVKINSEIDELKRTERQLKKLIESCDENEMDKVNDVLEIITDKLNNLLGVK